MTPPLSIDDEVEEITTGHRFKVSQIFKNCDGSMGYSAIGEAYHPASSLRLVDDELKIGDFVEIVGKSVAGYDDIGTIGKIGGNNSIHSEYQVGMGIYPVKSLRKLTPEEIQQHMQPKIELSQEALEKILERLSAIGKQLAEHGRLIAVLNEDSRLDDDRFDDIEKRLEEHQASHKTRRGRIDAVEQRLAVLEGEKPEVCDSKPDIEPISIAILGNRHHTNVFKCPAEAMAWCEKVMDGMREAR